MTCSVIHVSNKQDATVEGCNADIVYLLTGSDIVHPDCSNIHVLKQVNDKCLSGADLGWTCLNGRFL